MFLNSLRIYVLLAIRFKQLKVLALNLNWCFSKLLDKKAECR